MPVSVFPQVVTTTLTLVATFRRFGTLFTEASIEIRNVGPQALNACEVRRSSERMATAYVLAASTGDFADVTKLGCVTPAGVAGDPTVLASGLSVLLEVPFGPHTQIEVWARVAAGTSTVIVTGES